MNYRCPVNKAKARTSDNRAKSVSWWTGGLNTEAWRVSVAFGWVITWTASRRSESHNHLSSCLPSSLLPNTSSSQIHVSCLIAHWGQLVPPICSWRLVTHPTSVDTNHEFLHLCQIGNLFSPCWNLSLFGFRLVCMWLALPVGSLRTRDLAHNHHLWLHKN